MAPTFDRAAGHSRNGTGGTKVFEFSRAAGTGSALNGGEANCYRDRIQRTVCRCAAPGDRRMSVVRYVPDGIWQLCVPADLHCEAFDGCQGAGDVIAVHFEWHRVNCLPRNCRGVGDGS